MQAIIRYILFTGVTIVGLSILYFLSLTIHVPFGITAIISATLLVLAARKLSKLQTPQAERRHTWLFLLFLTAGLFLIIKKTYILAEVHGGWDAWAIWNLHAKLLAQPDYWKLMFLNVDSGHPDYPLGQPAFLAFMFRLSSGHFTTIIPFIFSFVITLVIPLLVYFDVARKNVVIAVAALFFFCQDMFYLSRGVSQYADTLLAFLFLSAIVCLQYATHDRRYIVLSAFFAASCAWVKNEGIILAMVFFVFNFNVFRRNIRFLIIGVALPVFTVCAYKFLYAPANDMIAMLNGNLLDPIKDSARYNLIWEKFKLNLNTKFYFVKISVFTYGLICLLQKRFPDRQLLMLFATLIIYMGFYVLTPHDLEWHLITSLDRLMHQLMPAFIYVMAQRFAAIRFTLPEQKIF